MGQMGTMSFPNDVCASKKGWLAFSPSEKETSCTFLGYMFSCFSLSQCFVFYCVFVFEKYYPVVLKRGNWQHMKIHYKWSLNGNNDYNWEDLPLPHLISGGYFPHVQLIFWWSNPTPKFHSERFRSSVRIGWTRVEARISSASQLGGDGLGTCFARMTSGS